MEKRALSLEIDEKQLQAAENIMRAEGITIEDAFDLFLTQIVYEGKIPSYMKENKVIETLSADDCSMEEMLEELDMRR